MREIWIGMAIALVVAATAGAQNWDQVEIKTVEVGGGVYMLQGAGGNIGVSVGDDGVFVIDDQYAPLSAKIVAAIGALSDGEIRFVLNTHWHADHTGGNESFGESGALIVAHDNVRKRLQSGGVIEYFKMTMEPQPDAALPVITFNDEATFHWNGDAIHAVHTAHAHTDGDAVVRFEKANVIHMGDIFFHGMYPFIDVPSGGTIGGVITAVERALAECDAATRVIPGHGPLTDRAGLAAYRDLLVGVRDAVAALKAAGKSRDEVVAAAPTAPWDGQLGKGSITPDAFAGFVYDTLE